MAPPVQTRRGEGLTPSGQLPEPVGAPLRPLEPGARVEATSNFVAFTARFVSSAQRTAAVGILHLPLGSLADASADQLLRGRTSAGEGAPNRASSTGCFSVSCRLRACRGFSSRSGRTGAVSRPPVAVEGGRDDQRSGGACRRGTTRTAQPRRLAVADHHTRKTHPAVTAMWGP